MRTTFAAMVLALFLVRLATAAQEVVLTTGERLPGRVEKYENGLAHIIFVQEDGSSILTTLPESMIDKTATDATRDAAIATESAEADLPLRTADRKVPASEPLGDDPSVGLTDLAANERSRRQALQDSGASPAPSFSDADVRANIPTSEEVQALADVSTPPDADQGGQLDGMAFYEQRLNTLANAFTSLGDEWDDMWLQCSPVEYDETSNHRGNAVGTSSGTVAGGYASTSGAGVYAGAYRENVYTSYRGTTFTSGVINRWTPACTRKHQSILSRGREIVNAYDAVYEAYESYAVRSLQVSRMMYRQLPAP